MNRVIEQFTTAPRRWPPSAPESFAQLTAREREIVTLVARGLANGEIAERLIISPATAKTHVSRAMGKLQVRDRAKLVALAYETGFVMPSLPPTGTPPRRDPAGRACAEDHDRASGPSRRFLLRSWAPGACADG
jgi:DNA-binding CsgD family transcriptional regulator